MQVAYEKKLRELQKSRIDGEEFIQLRRRLEELRPLKDRQSALTRAEADHRERRRNLLAEWEDAKAEEFRALERAAKRVTKRLRGRVRVQVEFGGNREPLFEHLRHEVGGRLSESINTLRQADNLSLSAFVQACRRGAVALLVKFDISGVQADRLAQASDETLMKAEELDLPSTTEIELNTAPPDEKEQWQALDQLSTGQKATAVLLLLLLESDAPACRRTSPRTIWTTASLRRGLCLACVKRSGGASSCSRPTTQIFPSSGTQSSSLGLSPSGEAEEGNAQIAQEHMGSIDTQPVRELVEELLEGGEDAFERRRRKYGF